jgi:hypothetical protein
VHLRDLKAERGVLGLKDTFRKPFGIPFFFQRDFLSLHEGLVLEHAVGHRTGSSCELRICHGLVVNWRICSLGEFVLHSVKYSCDDMV